MPFEIRRVFFMSEHAKWVERALASGRHLVVDNASFTRLADGERLVARAGLVDGPGAEDASRRWNCDAGR